MIKYDTGRLGLTFVLRCRGSVFPKALLMAIPNAVAAVLLHMYYRQDQSDDGNGLMNMSGVDMLWAAYTSVLGFLVVFRNNQAYTRFWEGATLINQVRGEWFNAVSSLFAFCNTDKEFDEQVKVFQHMLIRLASMLYCSALQQVCDLDDDRLEIIETKGMDKKSLVFMQGCNDRCEVILQWMQRLIMDADHAGILQVQAPILTRPYQELSRGIVNLNNARKIKDIPFPFPYAQMITCMMMVHWVVTPIMSSQVISSRLAAGVLCFFVTFSLWCLVYIGLEIDQPFGEDANDLPLRDMQRDFNQSLLTLMHPLAQAVPAYNGEYDVDCRASSFCSNISGVSYRKSLSRTLDQMFCDSNELGDPVEGLDDVVARAVSLRGEARQRNSYTLPRCSTRELKRQSSQVVNSLRQSLRASSRGSSRSPWPSKSLSFDTTSKSGDEGDGEAESPRSTGSGSSQGSRGGSRRAEGDRGIFAHGCPTESRGTVDSETKLGPLRGGSAGSLDRVRSMDRIGVTVRRKASEEFSGDSRQHSAWRMGMDDGSSIAGHGAQSPGDGLGARPASSGDSLGARPPSSGGSSGAGPPSPRDGDAVPSSSPPRQTRRL